MTTCLVGHPSIEAATPCRTPSRTPRRNRLRIAPSLRIAPGHSGLHRSSRLPATTFLMTNHRLLLLGKTDKWEPWPPSTSTYSTQSYSPATYIISHLAINRTILPLGLSTTIPVHLSTLGGSCPNRCEATWQPSMPVSWKYSTSLSVCIHCFLQYTPKLLKLFYSVAYIPQEYSPPLNFQTIPPWPVPRLRLSSRLVRKVVPTLVRSILLLPDLRSIRLILLLLLQEDVPPERRTTLSLLRPILPLLLTCSQTV